MCSEVETVELGGFYIGSCTGLGLGMEEVWRAVEWRSCAKPDPSPFASWLAVRAR